MPPIRHTVSFTGGTCKHVNPSLSLHTVSLLLSHLDAIGAKSSVYFITNLHDNPTIFNEKTMKLKKEISKVANNINFTNRLPHNAFVSLNHKHSEGYCVTTRVLPSNYPSFIFAKNKKVDFQP